VKTRVDLVLRDEAARFSLRFSCDECAHFDAERARCVHGYPPGPRSDALEREDVWFCKEFELG
jgi:hypothetical protein